MKTLTPYSLLKLALAVMLIAVVSGFVTVAVLISVFERKQEGKEPYFRVVELTDDTQDPAVWGQNFPHQYDSYTRTTDMVRTKHGGSEAMPHQPNERDPRMVVSSSKIEADPRLVTMWKGYAFSADFREERGHAYMLDDQKFTKRQDVAAQPGTCLHCHASVYLAYKKAGDGDIIKGFEKLNPLPYHEAAKEVTHPVACIDCHDSQTMDLRITRPGFIEGIRAYKAFQGVPDYDPNKMATRQEMRTYVCAQCHVEYYFKGPEKRLVYPWSEGIKGDQILAYYDKVGHKDWVHTDTGTPALKAQHPEFELWSQGVHARAGVACADCHMPYQRIGAAKVTDHHINSPLLKINRACQTCHHVSEAELLQRAETIQDRTIEMRDTAMDAVVELIADLTKAKTDGTDAEKLAQAQQFHRQAQFLLDFVEAENSIGFHAPQEAARLLTKSVDLSRKGQLLLRE